MPTLRDIKRRIGSVKNTRQITKAMKMVAAAKLRKAQTKIIEARPYANKMASVLGSLALRAERDVHPLLLKRPRKTVEVIILTGDRGLCGAFNSNIIRRGVEFIKKLRADGLDVNICTIGRKGRDYFKRRDIPLRKMWTGLSGRVSYFNAQEIAQDIIDNYINETVDEVYLAYNEFRSVMVQRVTIMKLLPIEPIEETGETFWPDFIYEPSAGDIYDRLLPKHIEIQVFRALLESQASEEAARMTAMENATKNSDEMIEKLTLQYNKARQAAITKELMDIVGGVEALK